MSDTRFSVLMSVYHADRPDYVDEALCSIWDDQLVKPHQIVIVRDGKVSADLEETIAKWKRKLNDVLTVLELPANGGLAAALNHGMKYCLFDLVARMDADDISLPHRFGRQLEFMDANPHFAASSAWVEEFDGSMKISHGIRKVPYRQNEIASFAKRRNPLSHPVSIFRKAAVEGVGGYPLFQRAQDYALWTVMLQKNYQIGNIPEVLLKMRTGDDLFKRRGISYFKHEIKILRFQHAIGYLNAIEFVSNLTVRCLARISPRFLKRIIYQLRSQ